MSYLDEHDLDSPNRDGAVLVAVRLLPAEIHRLRALCVVSFETGDHAAIGMARRILDATAHLRATR